MNYFKTEVLLQNVLVLFKKKKTLSSLVLDLLDNKYFFLNFVFKSKGSSHILSKFQKSSANKKSIKINQNLIGFLLISLQAIQNKVEAFQLFPLWTCKWKQHFEKKKKM